MATSRVAEASVPPHSDEAEISVLGAMLLEPEAVDQAIGLVQEDDFYHPAHRHIFRAISGLRDQGHNPDALAVREELRRLGTLEEAGGDGYLARIVEIVPTAANLTYHASTVLDLAAKRRLIEAGNAIIEAAYANGRPSTELHAEALERIAGAGPRSNGREGRRRICILAEEELYAAPRPKWTVDGVLPSDGTSEIFGAAKSGKTLVALDLALCIQTGTPWYGHEVTQGQVLYIIGEGQSALPNRIDAWKVPNRWDLDRPTGIWTITNRLSLLRDEDFQELRAEIRDFRARLGHQDDPILLTVLDTLNRTFGGGDENKTADMTLYTERMDLFREDTGGNVVAVHHTGHENTERGRGSSVLIGAVDTSIQVVKSGRGPWFNVEVTCNEQRNAEPFESLRFQMEPHLEAVTLGHVGDSTGAVGLNEAELADNQRKILEAVQRTDVGDGSSAGTLMEETRLAKSSFYHAAKILLDRGLLAKSGKKSAARYMLTDAGRKVLESNESNGVQSSPTKRPRSESSPVQGSRDPGLLDSGLDKETRQPPSKGEHEPDEPSVEELARIVAFTVEANPECSHKALKAHLKEADRTVRPALWNAAIKAAEDAGYIKDEGKNGRHAYVRTTKPIERKATC